MIALVICGIAFAACYWSGRRSLGTGIIALLAFGYLYGILRANLITTFSHFIFDAGLFGLYLSQKWTSSDPVEAKRLEKIRIWILLLIGWPLLLVFLPFQPLLISLVGLRGNIFFLPVVLLGSRLQDKDLMRLSLGLAALDLMAACFGAAEYVLGVPRFFPYSPVTQIIYMSADVAGGFFRIPATFTSAHAYGGVMVGSIPYMIGGWLNARNRMERWLLLSGIGAAMMGVLMSATRLNFIMASALIFFSLVSMRMKASRWVIFGLLMGVVAWIGWTNPRFQRFKTLSDTEAVEERVSGSVNRSFFEILFEYPMGNGLGGGGTSVPYFLQGQVRNPVQMENEYARILAEQGLIGLALWLAFVAWFLTRFVVAFQKVPWSGSRRMIWCLGAFSLSTAWIGVGMLTAIPGTVLGMLGMGWVATAQPLTRRKVVQRESTVVGARYFRPIPTA